MAIAYGAKLVENDYAGSGTTNGLPTQVVTPSGGGVRVVVIVYYWRTGTQTISSVTDGVGSATYTRDKQILNGTGDCIEFWSGMSTGMASGTNINVNFSAAPTGGVLVSAHYLTGATAGTGGVVTSVSGGTAGGSAWNAGTATNTGFPSAIFMGACGFESTTSLTSTPGSGVTEFADRYRASDQQGITGGYKVVTTVSSNQISGTLSGSGSTLNLGAMVVYSDGVAASGGTTYTKSGVAVGDNFNAHGPDVVLFADTGTGLSDFTGHGFDVTTLNRTGKGVSDFTGHGPDASTFVETGAGVSAFSASGPRVMGSGVIYTKAGTAYVGIYHPYVKTGNGQSDFTGHGPDVTTYVETGKGVSSFSASGARVGQGITYSKTGAGLVGTRPITYTKTGTGVADFDARGAKVNPGVGNQYSKTGTGFVGLIKTPQTYAKTGTGVSDFDAHGPKTYNSSSSNIIAKTGVGVVGIRPALAKTGKGVMGPVAFGFTSGQHSYLKKNIAAGGSGRPVGLLLAITRASGFSASGSKTVSQAGALLYTKTGRGISQPNARGADADLSTHTGTGVSPRVASGSDSAISADTGTAVSAFGGHGADAMQVVKTGKGLSTFGGSGASLLVRGHTGTGVSAFSASGTTNKTLSKTGTGISPFTGDGHRGSGQTYSKANTGVSAFSAQGGDAATSNHTGTGVAGPSVRGADAAITAETGIATLTAQAGGVRGGVIVKSGRAISDGVVRGSRNSIKAVTGRGVSALTGGGGRGANLNLTGTGVTQLIASGFSPNTVIFTKTIEAWVERSTAQYQRGDDFFNVEVDTLVAIETPIDFSVAVNRTTVTATWIDDDTIDAVSSDLPITTGVVNV